MKKNSISIKPFLLALLCCWVGILGANAQQTRKLSLQGFLKDANGKAIADGPQTITFRLYSVATGGTAEWTDTQTVSVFGGVYSTKLGSSTNPINDLDWNTKTYYVGISVQGTELLPRTEMPYAAYSLGSPKAQEVVCSGAVGDVKFSNLNPTQFAAANGDCWVPMDGRALATTDKLRQLTGLTTLPNGGGMFLRSQEFADTPATTDPDRTATSPIATFQDQSTLSHTHTNTVSSNTHTHNDIQEVRFINSGGGFSVGYYQSFRGDVPFFRAETIYTPNITHTHTPSISNTGGTETRPKNLNAWLYIRIN